jgi:hypothetical protein
LFRSPTHFQEAIQRTKISGAVSRSWTFFRRAGILPQQGFQIKPAGSPSFYSGHLGRLLSFGFLLKTMPVKKIVALRFCVPMFRKSPTKYSVVYTQTAIVVNLFSERSNGLLIIASPKNCCVKILCTSVSKIPHKIQCCVYPDRHSRKQILRKKERAPYHRGRSVPPFSMCLHTSSSESAMSFPPAKLHASLSWVESWASTRTLLAL